ncbi:hypothetical protein N665_0197s0051 [Sinapis alba]|nr:hypothetical protein N665_0197s0051 [Sinapis alba]
MGNISELPEDLLLRILSFVPTKDIVETSLVSKSWRSLRTKVSRLTYDAPCDLDKFTGFTRFLKESLLSHQPHSLETLHIDVCLFPIDIRPWIKTDVLSNLRELKVEVGMFGHISLPSVLFTCKKLVVLKLSGRIEVSVPSKICLPSLKTLHFFHLRLFSDESIHRILTNCPLVSDLRLQHDVMSKLHVVMPRLLQRLTIVTNSCYEPSPTLLDCYIRGFEIRTPSLKYLNIQDLLSKFCLRVRIRSPSNFEDTSIYRRIVHLELSMCRDMHVDLLINLLKHSTNLLVLKINNKHTTLNCWKPPSSVPTCLLSTLQILEWREYTGTCAEMEVVSYLLKHSLCLKTANIFTESLVKHSLMMDDLLSMPRGSTTCLLVLE